MHPNDPAVPSDTLSQDGRKMWTAPVVSFLAIDETATGTTTGDDGLGVGTGS